MFRRIENQKYISQNKKLEISKLETFQSPKNTKVKLSSIIELSSIIDIFDDELYPQFFMFTF